MLASWFYHMVLELVGGGIVRCLLLLCNHDHLPYPWMNRIVRSRVYRWTLWFILVAITSLIMVHLDAD